MTQKTMKLQHSQLDLQKAPFYLNEEAMEWVLETYNGMSLEEKIGQLFVPIVFMTEQEALEGLVKKTHIGGALYREGDGATIQKSHRILQNASKIPMLLAANLEHGGTGIATEGTYFGKPLLVAATDDAQKAWQLGKVACEEGAAVGVNWSFAPIVDIDVNIHNPITNVRTFGNDPKRVEEMGRAYVRAAKEAGVATSVKHFPGDGIDERDQHLVTSVNTLSKDEWDQSFGKVYRGMVDEGTLTVMAGHIALPAYDDEYLPATLSKKLLQGLLREQLGFNGLIVSDATPMIGFCSAMSRREAVPNCIEAGCDMFLFNKNLDEDLQYMKEGYEKGLLSEKRLEEALLRILATKAALNLHTKQKAGQLVPGEEALATLGNDEFTAWAKECADQGITLVKDTQNLLPLKSEKHKRMLLQILGEFGSKERVTSQMKKLLENEGFEITLYEKEDFGRPIDDVETFRSKYDVVLYVANIETASNKTVARIDWHTFFGQGNNIPWFVKEVPTAFVSVGNPYHLLDVPMIRTFINAYSNSDIVLEKTVEKLVGKSAFMGISPVDAFCGLRDTAF